MDFKVIFICANFLVFSMSAPVEVQIGFYVRDLFDISSEHMEYKLHYDFFVHWKNSSLGQEVLDKEQEETKWEIDDLRELAGFTFKPEVDIDNAKALPQIFNTKLNVKSTGEIEYLQKRTSVVSCQMDLRAFPLDSQTCPFKIKGFSYDSNKQMLSWLGDSSTINGSISGRSMPLKVSRQVFLDSWNMVDITASNCTETRQAPRSCLQIEFHLQRKLGFFLFQIYLPKILLVSLSWICFWMKMDPSDKVSYLLTGILSILVIGSDIDGQLPRVSYVKALDIWNFVCLAFTALAMVEVTIVTYREEEKPFKNPITLFLRKKKLESEKARPESSMEDRVTEASTSDKVAKKYPNTLDHISRYAFPIAFLIFNIIYWAYYLHL